MARTILIWGPTGLATPTTKLMLQTDPLTLTETITLTEHATIKRAYTGTVTAAAAKYFYNLLSAGAFVGGGTVTVKSVDATTSIADQSIESGISKNTALANFEFFMVDSSDHITGKTGLTITATRSIDGAAFAACANSASEVANGVYKIDLAAADLNGDVVTLKFTATGADPRLITIRPTP